MSTMEMELLEQPGQGQPHWWTTLDTTSGYELIFGDNDEEDELEDEEFLDDEEDEDFDDDDELDDDEDEDFFDDDEEDEDLFDDEELDDDDE